MAFYLTTKLDGKCFCFQNICKHNFTNVILDVLLGISDFCHRAKYDPSPNCIVYSSKLLRRALMNKIVIPPMTSLMQADFSKELQIVLSRMRLWCTHCINIIHVIPNDNVRIKRNNVDGIYDVILLIGRNG